MNDKNKERKRIHHSQFHTENRQTFAFRSLRTFSNSILSQFKVTKIRNDTLCIHTYIIRFKFIYAGLLVQCVVLSTENARPCDELSARRVFGIETLLLANVEEKVKCKNAHETIGSKRKSVVT